jgi:hypothetical protein
VGKTKFVNSNLALCPVHGYKTDALWRYKYKLHFYWDVVKVVLQGVIWPLHCPVNIREIYSSVLESVNSVRRAKHTLFYLCYMP